MITVTLDARWPQNPKVVGLTDRARVAFIDCLCYCALNLTDGRVPTAAGSRRAMPELVRAGLAELVDDGWMIHDYLEYNPSRDAVLGVERSDVVSRASRVRGGLTRAAQAAVRDRGRFTSSRPADAPAPAGEQLVSYLVSSPPAVLVPAPSLPQSPSLPVPSDLRESPVPSGPDSPSIQKEPTTTRARVRTTNLVTAEFRQAMQARYPGIDADEVNEAIDAALGHDAARKSHNEQAYVAGWLRRDFARSAGNAGARPRPHTTIDLPPGQAARGGATHAGA